MPLVQDNERVAIINFTNLDDWTTVTENEKTYKYYNYKLAPNESTSSLLESVTFNPSISNNSSCVTDTSVEGVRTITCNSTGNGYDGATYKLKFIVETIQYNKYNEAWGANIEVASEKPHPGTETLLDKTNPASITTYADGNMHEMYTFSHEATEQTSALTDYRYIGDDPYNYVYFNCNSGNNQNAENCEVWRIIGVFNFDDGTGNVEQRMKLVRGSLLENRYFNEESNNDWTVSPLKTYLNGNYYNGSGTNSLKQYSRSMVANSKYYLGTLSWYSSYGAYGSAESMYVNERGNRACYECDSETLSWNGDVALMYASDLYLTYAYGVDDTCYENPNRCPYGEPGLSWIHLSNKFLTEEDIDSAWLLSTCDNMLVYAFLDGGTNGSGSNSSLAVRPVVYLNADVKIIDGTGESTNPYVLSN